MGEAVLGGFILSCPVWIAGIVRLAIWLRKRKDEKPHTGLMVAWIVLFAVELVFLLIMAVGGSMNDSQQTTNATNTESSLEQTSGTVDKSELIELRDEANSYVIPESDDGRYVVARSSVEAILNLIEEDLNDDTMTQEDVDRAAAIYREHLHESDVQDYVSGTTSSSGTSVSGSWDGGVQPSGNSSAGTSGAATPTVSQQNALESAQSYLSFTAFSYQGLIDQLEYEQYSTEDATWAADNCGADWNQQATKKAQSYLDFTSFSRQGLIDQLLYEGFTQEQAEYGVNAVGL